MNGQLNGFHEAFIEEGTFLFTSESVGEGHPGERTGGFGRRTGRWRWGSRPSGSVSTAAAARSPGVAPRGCSVRPPLPSPLSPIPIRRRAPARGRFQKTRRAGARDRRGEGPVSSSLVPSSGKISSGRPRPACSRPAVGSARPALQRQPRVHRMWHRGEAELPAARFPSPWVRSGGWCLQTCYLHYPRLPVTENAQECGWTCP